MDDALESSSWRQPNTFMDIMAPRVKNSLSRTTPMKSETLMRSAVKKPIAVQDTVEDSQEASLSEVRKDLTDAASLTNRSPLISRFQNDTQYDQPDNAETYNYPSMDGAQESAPVEQLAPAIDRAEEMAVEQPSLNIFKSGFPTSYDYGQAAPKASKWNLARRFSGWTVVAIVGVGLVAGGLFVNRNLSKFELYLASSRAGFSATLPGLKPSGYGLVGISTGSGMIEASYKSNSDGRTYSISEKKSSVSSSALLNSYVQSQAGMNFQTISTEGRTIYVYSGHDASWVSNGIWYILQDNNSLSDHQIIDIANSM